MIDRIIKLENQIADCYYKLCLNEINNLPLDNTMTFLNSLIKQRNTLFDNLTYEEYSLFDITKIKGNDLINKYYIFNHLKNIININYINKCMKDEIFTKDVLLKKITIDSKAIVIKDYLKVFLSLHDEIKESFKESCYINKYLFLYNYGAFIEDDLKIIKDSPYLTSNIEARALHVPLAYVNELKKFLVDFSLKDFIDNSTKENEELSSKAIALRSALVLLNIQDEKKYIAKLGISLNNPIYEMFMLDREKYKIISLSI